jgi:hypothetical protein
LRLGAKTFGAQGEQRKKRLLYLAKFARALEPKALPLLNNFATAFFKAGVL